MALRWAPRRPDMASTSPCHSSLALERRDRGREGERERGREGGREGEREGGTSSDYTQYSSYFSLGFR